MRHILRAQPHAFRVTPQVCHCRAFATAVASDGSVFAPRNECFLTGLLALGTFTWWAQLASTMLQHLNLKLTMMSRPPGGFDLAALGFWGVGAGATVAYLMSDVPLFRKDILNKLPIVSFLFKIIIPTLLLAAFDS